MDPVQVRDRAMLYLEQLGGTAGGPEAIVSPWPVPGTNLEAALKAYLEGPTDAPFDLVRPFLYYLQPVGSCCLTVSSMPGSSGGRWSGAVRNMVYWLASACNCLDCHFNAA